MMSNRLSIRSKLMLAFGLLIAMVICICAMVVREMDLANNAFEGYIKGIAQRSTVAHMLRESIDARAIAARNLVLVSEPDDVAIERAAVRQSVADVRDRLARLRQLAREPGVADLAKAKIDDMARIEGQYEPIALDIVGKALKGDRQAAQVEMNTRCRPLLAALTRAADDYSNYNVQQSTRILAQAQAELRSGKLQLLIACAVAVGLALAAAALIIPAILHPLGQAVDVVMRVAGGDLTSDVSVTSRDEFGRLQEALKRMQSNLVGLIGKVLQGSDSVSAASAQIAQGNQNLSTRTESQASAVQQTASSMEQLGSAVQQNADNAGKANQLAVSASTFAEEGGLAVSRMVETMQSISDSSKKIGDIINVVDALAFQTNILALNAAVEAARAGDHGRGFAVVASEVRSLAQRSTCAAREIKTIISASVACVDQGARLADKAGTTMNDVVASMHRVTDVMRQISVATTEQSGGVREVGHAVGRIDQSTQQNAALVEEVAAAAASLSVQAKDLVQAASAFKVPGALMNVTAS